MYDINSDIGEYFNFVWGYTQILKDNLFDAILEIIKWDDSFEFYNSQKIKKVIGYLSNEKVTEIFSLLENNFWINYFLKNMENINENWIDFEKGISDFVKKVNTQNFWSIYEKYCSSSKYLKSEELIEVLEYDLKRVVLLLEMYLYLYISHEKISKSSKDISNLNINCVLSFNYTNIYGKEKNIEYDYIHGKADINNTIETNNMVLGIDEYLPEDRKNTDIEFIAFKKFYQRIYKQTGCKYKQWVDEIKESEEETEERLRKKFPTQIPFEKFNNKHYLYIFGHSLDVTDGDVLRDLILNDNVYTTIFYHNKDVMGQQIANLVKVIGQDELIRRTGGSTKTIEFRQQQDMVPTQRCMSLFLQSCGQYNQT